MVTRPKTRFFRSADGLVNADAVLFFEHQFVENRQYFFPVAIHAAEGIAEIAFVAVGMKPLMEERTRDIDILAQGISGVATQKKAVENCRFPLRRERVKIVATGHIFILHLLSSAAEAADDSKSSLSQQSNNAVKSLKQNNNAASQKSPKKYIA
jgi:hypothetical protein